LEQEDLEKKSREVFHEIHKIQGSDQKIFNRISNLLSPEYLRVSNDFFKEKICLDAGCGSNANATYKMLRMGAKKVYAFDLDETIFRCAGQILKEFDGRYELSCGNVLNMSFDDNFFDFTHCAGVLHHTHDVFRGLSELARVTNIGGILYIETYGKGGLVREITSMLREKYMEDERFRFVVENLQPTDLTGAIKWIFSVMEEHGDVSGKKIPWRHIEELIDNDLILTIKDRIMAPSYEENSEEELVNWLNDNGFTEIERLTRYPMIKNIRKFLSPFYFKYDSEMARFLYGSGGVQLKAVKDK
jgi:ubiquinone/menaquinone biosynthesis C-methylase UbiE|tara:strand:- start:3682 stop:4587 length:906 start_codon:yes stop_codon:yes gene_type:complete